MKTYFIVSDLHARFNMLQKALHDNGFNYNDPNHILVIAGDILDRGPEGKEMILYLESLLRKDKLIGVLGNHDLFLKDIINHNWKKETVIWNVHHNGFLKTLEVGYGKSLEDERITEEILEDVKNNFLENYPLFCDWLDNLPLMLIFDKHVIVHGFLDFYDKGWKNTEERFAIWERGYKMKVPDDYDKKIIMGHTPNYHINNQDDIIYEDKKIMIDGGAAMDHQINVLILTEEEI